MHISDNWCNVEARYSLLHLNWIPVLIWTAKIWTVITNPNPVLTVQISLGNFTVQILTVQILSGYHLKQLTISHGWGWWRWALVSPHGVAPSQMVCVSASVNLPLHHKSRSSLLAPAHLGGPGKRAVKWLWCGLPTSINNIQENTSNYCIK